MTYIMIVSIEGINSTRDAIPLHIEREFDLDKSIEWCFQPGIRKDLGHPQRAYYGFGLVATMLTEKVDFLFAIPSGDGMVPHRRSLRSDDFPSSGIDPVTADIFMSNVAGKIVLQSFMESLGIVMKASKSSLQAVRYIADILFLLDQPQQDVSFLPVKIHRLRSGTVLSPTRKTHGLQHFIEREWQIERWRRQQRSIHSLERRKALRANSPDLREASVFLKV